ncbi:beta strand repeat-containing protein [Haloferula rosea]|uniref:Ig-like domain-containing protein n=1 Tax=Haloferula rosea TaxID=490093 RepID=A0A934REZ0_9BACT|nr:hypothetical protein [Haloferula rosea]MBK1827316.1 hypothetical protein [Haloferula rosea]
MKKPTITPNGRSTCLTLLLAIPLAHAAEVALTPGGINGLDSATIEFDNGDILLTPLQNGVPATFNANADRLGIDDFGTNANALNDPDTTAGNANDEQLEFVFSPNSGLTRLSWDFARADGPLATDGVRISGFTSDPLATLTGPGTSGLSYSAGTLRFDISSAGFTGTDGVLTLANPAASTGATLLLTVNDSTQAGAQLPITGISYEDAVPTKAPVLDPPLPATLAPGIGVSTTLTAALEAGTAPGPTYLWEYDDGGGFVTVSTTESVTFVAGPAADGDYRITVSNGVGSDAVATVAVSAIDDGDGIDNQWEVDNFGDFLLYDETDDVDTQEGTLAGTPAPDGRNNFQEWTDNTNPLDPDTDDDGLTDGEEVVNSTNPLLADTDGDGYSDGYEVNDADPATLPNDAASSPGVDDNRNAIGITFNTTNGQNPNTTLGPLMLAGAPGYSQKNWNSTIALAGNATSTTDLDVATPSTGVLVDSNGNSTTAGFTIGMAGVFSVPNNSEQPYGGLYSAYLFADAVNDTVEIDVTDIPYSRYDVVIYPLGFNGNQRGTLLELASGKEFAVRTPALLANGTEPTYYLSADQTTASSGDFENFPRATHLVFRGLTSDVVTLDLVRTLDNIGIAAIQIVEDLDSDGDGMGDNYEISVGLDPNDDGTTDPLQAPGADFDSDTISNIDEHNAGTNPTSDDTDNDGYLDQYETDTGIFVSITDTGTDPRIADFDSDGILDGAETNSGNFVAGVEAGTDPIVFSNGDADNDGYRDDYEWVELGSDLYDPEAPGGPNPDGFGIAFNAVAGVGGAAGAAALTEFGPGVYAGAPGIEMKNWNRTIDLANNATDASGDILKIATPSNEELVDSSGNIIGDDISGVGLTFTAGAGAYSSVTDARTPYGRLFNSFIYGNNASGNNDSSVSLTGIPYTSYDVYVYFGSDSDGRTGTLTDGVTTYSFTTDSNTGFPGVYTQTTDTGSGFPQANYAVFSGQTGTDFNVTVTTGALQNSMGIYGVQVINTGATGGAVVSLANPALTGSVFTADFTTDTAGTYILERSLTLNNDWVQVGSPLVLSPGTTQVTDPSAPTGKAFYRVSEQ